MPLKDVVLHTMGRKKLIEIDHYLSLVDLLLTMRLFIFLTVQKMYYCDILKMKIPIDIFIILSGQGHLKSYFDNFYSNLAI